LSDDQPRTLSPRIVGIIVACVLGWFLFGQVRSAWLSYWLLRDAQTEMAVVTKFLWTGHGVVEYRYVVQGHEYAGHSRRNWQDPRYSNVQAGEKAVVYFSASHPWLSCLYMPRTLVEGAPVVLIVIFLESLAIGTIIRPKGRWAFNLEAAQRQTVKK